MRHGAEMRLRVLMGLSICVAAACVPDPAGRSTATTSRADGSPSPSKTMPASPRPAATATGGASPSFVRPTPRPSPTFLVYEVRAGDTLTSIARQFGTTARSIAYWNRAAYPSLDPDAPTYEPGLIKVGWILLLIPTTVVDEDELEEPASPPSPNSSPV